MAVETLLKPRPPYSLALSARTKSDATRVLRNGILTLAYEAGSEPAVACVRQLPDGPLEARIESARPREALETLRFVLALDDDHMPFLREFADDPLLGERTRTLRGLRPLRTATVVHALLKAVCGQLIQAKAARLLEAKLLRSASPAHGELRLPPTRATFASYAPAELVRAGLAARKAATLVRLCRTLDVERLRRIPTDAAGTRIERERGLGPWSAGMVCLFGLGRYERGLVGDLGLIKLCSSLLGRWAEPEDTARLLEPYGEWAGLASVYLLAGFSKSKAQRNGFSETYRRRAQLFVASDDAVVEAPLRKRPAARDTAALNVPITRGRGGIYPAPTSSSQTMPWRWFGITTNASSSTAGKCCGISAQHLATITPTPLGTNASSTIALEPPARFRTPRVTKYAPSLA